MAARPPDPSEVRLTSQDKLMFPDDGITKAGVVDYYVRVAETMLPHIRDRPVSMQVFHGGIKSRGHFMKQTPDYFPAWVKRVTVPKQGGTVDHLVANHPATLALLANHNVITPHVWSSRADMLHRPDRLIVDLDPSTDDFATVRKNAFLVADLLRQVGLEPFPMVTGSRGIHIVAPLRRDLGFDGIAELTAALADAAVDANPDELTTEFHKKNRDDKVYVDVGRSLWGQTAVPPYSLRPRPGAPVATPVTWEEVDSPELAPDGWSLTSVVERLEDTGDAWKDIAGAAGSPKAALKKSARLDGASARAPRRSTPRGSSPR